MKTEQKWKIGDNLQLLPEIPDKSVDLVIFDPPYYKVDDAAWDNQWKSFEEYLNWIEAIGIQLKRVLRNNGSLYLFGDDRNIAYIQVRYDKHFSFLNHLVWYKRNNQSIKGAANGRRYVCVSERILFYGLQDSTGLSEIHDSSECFRPIKDYMLMEVNKLKERMGFRTKEELNQYLNELTNTASVVSRHYFCDSQWVFPTKEIYAKLQTTGFFPIPWNELRYGSKDKTRQGYEDLRQGYEDLRQGYEAMRRPFNYHHGMYEVFDIPIINNNENTDHNTTKPLKLIERLVKNSSKEGDSILDPCLGSGTTLEACMRTNRNCMGIEISHDWEELYRKRLKKDIVKLDAYVSDSEQSPSPL